MRAFKIRTEPAILTTLKEPPKANTKGKIRWQRISFLSILILIISYIGLKVYFYLAIIQADGQIELYKQIINFPTDIMIEDLNIVEGQMILKGDTLLKYTIPVDDQVSTSEINVDRPIEWIQRERINTQKNIEIRKIQLQEIREQLALRNEMKQTKKSLILLGSYNDRNEFEELTIGVNRLEAEEKSIQHEIKYLENLLFRLNREDSNYKRIETRKKEIIQTKYYYIAKLDGIIGQINFNTNEICYKKEELMTIHRTDDVRIKAFFDPSEMKHLLEGDVVNINFPDHQTSKGLITNFHVATYALPEEFQKKYEPTERNIVAEIKLLESMDKPIMNYYKMNVLISKNRYNFKL